MSKAFQLIQLIQNPDTSYEELIKFIFGEMPPANHNFLSRVDSAVVTKRFASPAYRPLSENPHARPEIAFFIRTPFHYYIYKSIYRELSNAEFVVDLHWIQRNVPVWGEFLVRFLDFLLVEGVFFRVMRFPPEAAEEFFHPYQVLVANGDWNPLLLPCNADKRKARVMYGYGKELYNYGAWSRNFDLALTYGEYSNKKISEYTKCLVVGNTKLDDYFNGTVEMRWTRDLVSKLSPDKKTVLFAPTHTNLGGLEWILPALPEVVKDYDVIIRPHPFSNYVEGSRLSEFRDKLTTAGLTGYVLWMDDFVGMDAALRLADIFVSDNSGGIFDAVLADKPLVLLDFLDEEFLEKGIWQVERRSRDNWAIPLSNKESLEQKVKQMDVAEVVADPSQFKTALDRAPFLHDRERSALRKKIYTYADGNSGRRASKALQDLVGMPKPTPSFRNKQIDAEVLKLTTPLRDEIKQLRAVIQSYARYEPIYDDSFEILPEVMFSVIIPTFKRPEGLLRTLSALAEQTGVSATQFEIIVVNDGFDEITEHVVRNFIDGYPSLSILFLGYVENRGPAYARNLGILHARGRFIAFTDDDCKVPTDWLLGFQEDFRKNLEVGGIGGWYKAKGSFADALICRIYPRIDFPKKAVEDTRLLCGNTANVCYRASVLREAGGFNHYFRYANREDWELKIRIQRLRYALLYRPIMVEHHRWLGLREFLHHFAVRGWATFLIYKLYPDLEEGYSYTFFSALTRHFPRDLYAVRRYPAVALSRKIQYTVGFFVTSLLLWITKYSTALHIVKAREPLG